MLNTQVIANTVLMMAFEEEISVTPMKLQKILYFIYKEYLQKTNLRLFSESFEKWQYGPVLPSIYYEFKNFGSNSINKFARDAQGEVEVVNLSNPTNVANVIKSVWSKYKNYSAIELSYLTHKEGSAWDKATDYILNDEDIKNEPKLC